MLAHSHGSTPQKFLRTLSASLHQMAQPLSTIQASLELALLGPTTAEQYQAIAGDLLQHLGQAVESMQFTAWLARFHQPAADVQDVLLSAALESVISDLRRTLETAELQLLFFRPEQERLIRISVTRLRQMLFYVLQAVQGYSQPGDIVHIEIQAPTGHLILRIQRSQNQNDGPACSSPSQAGATERALALADAIVSCAGGQLSITSNPLRIVADFPVQCESKPGVVKEAELSGTANLLPALSSH